LPRLPTAVPRAEDAGGPDGRRRRPPGPVACPVAVGPTGHPRTQGAPSLASALVDERAAGGTITAVVVTHDRVGHLRRGVEALLAEPIDRLLVVDNRSGAATVEYL